MTECGKLGTPAGYRTTDVHGASMGDENRSRVLVTGGSGFIGRRLVRALVRGGAEVTVADLRAFPADTVRSVVGDLCDPAVVKAAVSPGTEVIIHLAAVTRVLLSIDDPAGTHALNVDATAGLLEQARLKDVSAFVLASTNAVTGDVGRTVITEQMPLRPLTPYGATKAAGEMLLGTYAALRAGFTGPLILGAGESVTVNEIVAAARSVTGADIPIENVPGKPGEMPAVIIDISAARALGYKPEHDLKSGMATVWPEFS